MGKRKHSQVVPDDANEADRTQFEDGSDEVEVARSSGKKKKNKLQEAETTEEVIEVKDEPVDEAPTSSTKKKKKKKNKSKDREEQQEDPMTAEDKPTPNEKVTAKDDSTPNEGDEAGDSDEEPQLPLMGGKKKKVDKLKRLVVNFQHARVNYAELMKDAPMLCKEIDKATGKPSNRCFIQADEKGVVADDEVKVNYVGTVMTPAELGAKYCVAKIDRRTKKVVRTFDVDFVAMKPVVCSGKEKYEDTAAGLDYMQQKEKLAIEFGSKKKRKVVETYKRNQVDQASTSFMAEETAVESSRRSLQSTTPSRSSGSSVIPPFNPNAQAPKEIYVLGTFLRNEEFLLAMPLAEAFINREFEELRSTKLYSDLTIQMAKTIKSASQKAAQLRLTVMLLYCDSLLTIHKNIHSNKGRFAKETECYSHIPDVFLTKIMTEFFGIEPDLVQRDAKSLRSITISTMFRDKVLAYGIVIAVLLGGLQVDLAALCDASGATLSKTQTTAKALGCVVVTQKLDRSRTLVLKFAPGANERKDGGRGGKRKGRLSL